MASNPQMTLALFLVREIVPNAIKKGLFGGPHIPFADLINICGYLFQSGAIIGRARRSQSESLATMFSEPGRESDAIDGIKSISTRHLDEYRRVFGEEPTAFPTYVTGLEYQRAGITMPFGKAQLTGSIQQHIKRVEKQSKDKVPLGFADEKLQMTAVEGIGFGIEFPELTEHMYREANENIDKKDWDNARQAGLDIPQNPDVITLEEQEDITLSEVAAYASQHYPRLVALLDLNKYLE